MFVAQSLLPCWVPKFSPACYPAAMPRNRTKGNGGKMATFGD
jgi:hypothetical protein